MPTQQALISGQMNLFSPPTEEDIKKRKALRIKNCKHEYERLDLIVDNSKDMTRLRSGIRCPICERVTHVRPL